MEDLIRAQDYEAYIQEKKEDMQYHEENCSNCYSDIKTLIKEIEAEDPNFDMTIFSDYLQILEEYYTSFTSINDVLHKFLDLNTEAKTLSDELEEKQKTIVTLEINKESLLQDITFKDQRVAKLEEEIQLITSDYISLYNSSSHFTRLQSNEESFELSDKDKDKDKEEKNKLMNKVFKLTEENSTLKLTNDNLMQKVDVMENDIRLKYILKNEHDKIVKDLKKAGKENVALIVENEKIIFKLRREISSLYEAKEELINDLDEKIKEIERLKREHEEFLRLPNFKKLPTINLNNIQINTEDFKCNYQSLSNIDEEYNQRTFKDTSNLVFLEKNDDSEKNSVHSNNNNNNHFQITPKEIITSMSNNQFEMFKEQEVKAKLSHRSPIMRLPTTRRMQEDYYKQYFLLTYQAMKLNSDVIDPFLIVSLTLIINMLYSSTQRDSIWNANRREFLFINTINGLRKKFLLISMIISVIIVISSMRTLLVSFQQSLFNSSGSI